MAGTRKVVLYIATSLDGYIAKPGDNLDFLDMADKEGEDYGYFDFIKKVDTMILGRRTYDWVMKHAEFPHDDIITYIMTRNHRPPIGKTQFYTGNLKDLVLKLQSEPGKNIFCNGGAEIVNQLLKDDLIDEFYISIIPVLVGDGIKLFEDGRPELKLDLVSAKSYDTGLVLLHYKRMRNE